MARLRDKVQDRFKTIVDKHIAVRVSRGSDA